MDFAMTELSEFPGLQIQRAHLQTLRQPHH